MAPRDGAAPASAPTPRPAPQRAPEVSSEALEHWLTLAGAGYHLAPVKVRRGPDGKKRPRFLGCTQTIGWADIATTDPEVITRWVAKYGKDVGMLIACVPSQLFVADLDLKPDQQLDGPRWWSERGLPLGSMVVDTPSGGQHLYWRQDKEHPLANTTGAIAPGIDTRGVGADHGGFVFAPGTQVHGERGSSWRLLDHLLSVDELDEVPPEVAELIPERRRRRSADRDPRMRSAGGAGHQLSWLRDEVVRLRERLVALPARDGHGFRYALLGLSMMAGRLHTAQGDARELAQAYLREAVGEVWGCIDEDDEEWIQTGLDDGIADPFTITPEDDEVLDPEVEPDEWDMLVDREYQRIAVREAAQQRYRAEQRPPRPSIASLMVWDSDLASVPAPAMALSELIPERGVGWLGGPSGSYKSFVAVSLAVSLAYGVMALEDREFIPSGRRRVLYAAGEGASGVALRIRALRHRLGVRLAGQLVLYPRALDLTDVDQVAELGRICVDEDIAFVVIDTFRQSTPGVKEVDNTEVGAVLRQLLELRDQHGIGSMLIDHTNKSAVGLADLGGAGAKRANADYVLMIDLPNGDRSSDQQRTLRVAKLKDLPDGRTWPIRLEQVTEVVDEDGNASAAVLTGALETSVGDMYGDHAWREQRAPEEVATYRGKGCEALSIVARMAMHYGGGDAGISRADVVAYYRAECPGLDRSTAGKRVRRAWDVLLELGRLQPLSPGSPAGAARWVESPVQ